MKLTTLLISTLFIILILICQISAQETSKNLSIFMQDFQLSGERSNEQQFFISETEVKTFNADGSLAARDVYKLFLKYVPGTIAEDGAVVYTCSKFEIFTNDSISQTVPVLKNWSYSPQLKGSGMDEKDQVFGIDHQKFENLLDNNNNSFPPDKSYMIYNAFIDFHAFCNVFAEETSGGKGIQDLHNIGDKILHSASGSKPPVNLGSNINEGSYFQNGQITLALKGLSLVNEKITSIVHYDSGESSFHVIMEPVPGMKINTLGRSHYFGDIFIDLNTKWVQKIIMAEIVMAQTKLPSPPNEINSVTERFSQIMNVSKSEFENQL